LILGAGGAIQFADGTTQSTAGTGGSSGGVPSGFEILGTSPVAPAGYTLVGSISSGNLWSFMAPMPTARYFLTATTVNGKIYAVGGSASGLSALTTVEASDPLNNTWSPTASLPAATYALAAAALNGKIYAIG